MYYHQTRKKNNSAGHNPNHQNRQEPSVFVNRSPLRKNRKIKKRFVITSKEENEKPQ